MEEKKPLLKVENISKKFCENMKRNMYYGMLDLLPLSRSHRQQLRTSEFWAVKNLSFDLYSGEILGIVGSNGSGKTTLMRLISNIYKLDMGHIHYRKDLRIVPVFALKAGMEPLFSGRENIFIKGAMYGRTRQEMEAQVPFIEEFSELGHKIDTPFGNYSSGMKSRLAYAIAAATNPDIFIIDEALAVGDSAFKTKCFDHLRSFVQKENKAVLFVSNNIRKVLKVASRVIVMKKGEIIFRSEDVREALNFYVETSVNNLDKGAYETKIKKIKDFEFE